MGEGFGVCGCLVVGVEVVFGAVGRVLLLAVGFVVDWVGFLAEGAGRVATGLLVGDTFLVGADVRVGEVTFGVVTAAEVAGLGAGRVGRDVRVEVLGGVVFVTRGR